MGVWGQTILRQHRAHDWLPSQQMVAYMLDLHYTIHNCGMYLWIEYNMSFLFCEYDSETECLKVTFHYLFSVCICVHVGPVHAVDLQLNL